MGKHQVNVRLSTSGRTLLKHLAVRSGLDMNDVVEYALLLVDEREIAAYANNLREREAKLYAA